MMRSAVVACMLVIASGPCRSADVAEQPRSERPLRIAPSRAGVVEPEPSIRPRADVFLNNVTTFRTMQDALNHCPGRPATWVPTLINPLHPGRSAIEGAYLCQADASSDGDRPW